MPHDVTTFCRICEAQCGLVATVDGDRILAVRPDTEHVVSKGYVCVKGLSIENVRASPDRLTHPLKKVKGGYERISWDQAFAEIGTKVRALRTEHGDDSVGLYFGNPISFSLLAPLMIAGFVRGLGTSKFFNTGSLDCNNKFAVSERMFGAGMALTFPDVDHTKFLMVIGGNPAVSRMSFIQLPDPMARLGAIVERGGRLVFVNPRRIESAKAAGEHLFIRPDTDVYFLFAFLHEILARDAVDHARVRAHMTGFDALADVVHDWTPEKQAEVTGIPAATLRALVTDYLAADGAALYASTGVNQGRNGTLAFWALEVINAITGNLDRSGGSLMGKGIIDYAKLLAKAPMTTRHSRIGQVPSLLDALPMALLADEILTPGPGQMRALFVMSGNPVITSANSSRLERALDALELMVSVEIVRNETANHAHYILPGTHFAERPDVPFTFLSLSGLTPIPWFQYTDRLVAPPGECRDETWILGRLAEACGAPLYGSRLLQAALDASAALGRAPFLGAWLQPLPERVLGWLARAGGQGSLAHLRRHPHGVLRPPVTGEDYLGQRVVTPDGKVHLAPDDFVALARERLPATFADERRQGGRLKLISRRERFSHNSWAHNDPAFIKGKRSTNYLYVHPDDAAPRGIVDGAFVRVTSATGEVVLPASLTDDMMPGSVALPHGWGHAKATGLSVASTTTGANVNILAADGPDGLEPISGMAQLTGI
ncbi:MAG: molybdopterin-dependent oxidoreductase, partial [Candidatus Binatia bacterium]